MYKYLPLLCLLALIHSCKTPSGIFSKKTAHDEYGDKIEQVGLRQTELGNAWFSAADKALVTPVPVQVPYKENGYFAAENIHAASFRFEAKKGEQLTIELSRIPINNFRLFADLYTTNGTSLKHLQSIDSTSNQLKFVVKENSNFVLRLQPELLKSGSYMVEIKSGPSLAFPVPSPGTKNRVISFWGDGRDNGARKHEGVDIGGKKGTPLIAIGDGYVSRVTENNLGGKVVFIRSEQGGESWYYAHLDSQIATNGQRVKAGDAIGLMGNTGNARTAAPHLHFGIYTNNGAIDPLPYINPEQKISKPVTASTLALGKRMRVTAKATLYLSPDLKEKEIAGDLPVLLTAATQQYYRAVLPGGETRLVAAANVEPIEKKIRAITLKQLTSLTDAPNATAPVIASLAAGSNVDLLGKYQGFQYIRTADHYGWIPE